MNSLLCPINTLGPLFSDVGIISVLVIKKLRLRETSTYQGETDTKKQRGDLNRSCPTPKSMPLTTVVYYRPILI